MKNIECEPLTGNQIEFACQQMCRWINICERQKPHRQYGCAVSAPDVDHSSLLRRLLSGKEPHEFPPPTSYSSPAWHMVEQDQFEISQISEYPNMRILDRDAVLYTGEVVAINQDCGYVWEDKEKKILRYVRLNLFFQYFEEMKTPKHLGEPGGQLSRRLIPEEHKYLAKYLKRLYPENVTQEKTNE